MTNELKTYAFTEDDINLITYALRQLSKSTGLGDLKASADNLLEYIEREKQPA